MAVTAECVSPKDCRRPIVEICFSLVQLCLHVHLCSWSICHVSEYLCTCVLVEISTLAYIHTFLWVCVFIYNLYIYSMCVYI